MQKITPFLWFDKQAEEAATFYCSVFKNAKILEVRRYPKGGPAPEGQAMTVSFVIEGLEFVGLNAGPHFKFNPAISMSVDCKTQAEVDDLWGKLLEGGRPSQCGWLEDKFGLSWQIIPEALPRLMADKNPKKSAAVMQAMMKMVKIDVAAIQTAYDAA